MCGRQTLVSSPPTFLIRPITGWLNTLHHKRLVLWYLPSSQSSANNKPILLIDFLLLTALRFCSAGNSFIGRQRCLRRRQIPRHIDCIQFHNSTLSGHRSTGLWCLYEIKRQYQVSFSVNRCRFAELRTKIGWLTIWGRDSNGHSKWLVIPFNHHRHANAMSAEAGYREGNLKWIIITVHCDSCVETMLRSSNRAQIKQAHENK